MATVGIGSDTGGSVRIPSGLCGLAGFKPTQRRVPTAGANPLSTSLDSIGPLAPTIACAARVHQVIAGEPVRPVARRGVAGLRLAVPQALVLEDMDAVTAQVFEAALSRLSKAGAVVTEIPFRELMQIVEANAKGGFAAPECYDAHAGHILRAPDLFDPRVLVRIRRATEQNAVDFVTLVRRRAEIQAVCNAVTAQYDAVLMPTTPRVAAPIADLEASDEVYAKVNALMLRNCSIGNFLDRCAATVPVHEPGSAPVGLMLMGETMGDDHLLSVAAAVESVFR